MTPQESCNIWVRRNQEVRSRDASKRKHDKNGVENHLYNSVVTLRHNIMNSSASVPLNAKKIAVKKDSEVGLSMFGPEL